MDHTSMGRWHREPTFIEKHPWVLPLIAFILFCIFAGIALRCAHKRRMWWWRETAVVVMQSNPGGNITHNGGIYPVGSSMNPYYPGVVVQNAGPPGNTAYMAGAYPQGTGMPPHYPGVNNYPNVPPPYSQQPQSATVFQNTHQSNGM